MTDGNGTAKSKSWNVMQAFVATTVLTGFFGMIFGWMVFPPKTSDAGTLAILNQLTGAVTTLAVAVVTYYVGSSKGSSDKDDSMSQSLQTSTQAVSALAAGTGTGAGATSTTSVSTEITKPHAPAEPIVTNTKTEAVTIPTDKSDKSKGDK